MAPSLEVVQFHLPLGIQQQDYFRLVPETPETVPENWMCRRLEGAEQECRTDL